MEKLRAAVLTCWMHSVAEQALDQARRLGARDDHAVAGEELIVGQRVAAILDSEPIDLVNLVVGLRGREAAPDRPSREGCWTSARPARSRPGPCRCCRP